MAGGFCPHSQEYKEPPHVCFEQKNAGDLPKSTETWSDDHLPIDIILLTVESCDFFSCFSLLDKPFKSYKKEIGYVYFGGIGDTSDQEKLKIALMRCSKGAVTPGGSLPAVLNAVRVLRPKAAFSVGTCISLGSEKVRMGDVVISCLLTAEGFRTPVSPLLRGLIQDAPNVWVAPLQNPGEMKVTVHCDGDILSQSLGEKCRCDDVFERFPGAVAIETEGKGLYAAAYELNIEWVIVKGVASYFHQSQSATSEWMYFASTMAASVVAEMLKEPTVFGEWPHYNQGVRYGTSGDHHSLRRYGDKIIKMLIQAAKLRKEQQEKAEKMLTQLAQSYEEFHDVSTDNGVGALEAFIEYIISAYEVVLIGVGRGSVIIILECIALENLERLWNDYVSGRLDEVAEGYLLTGKMKKELKLETNCLKITIHKENYLNCKKALMELPSTYSDSNMADAVSVLMKVVQLTKLSEEALRAINELLSSSSGEHDLVVGNPEDGDILLHSEKKSVGYGRSYVSHVYRYSGDVMITLVVAKDNWNNDTGGDPEIISGGPGHKHVEVKVTSRLLRGFDHTVLVFGKKRKRKRCNLM